jgi:hypothetical protein
VSGRREERWRGATSTLADRLVSRELNLSVDWAELTILTWVGDPYAGELNQEMIAATLEMADDVTGQCDQPPSAGAHESYLEEGEGKLLAWSTNEVGYVVKIGRSWHDVQHELHLREQGLPSQY